MSLRGVLKHAPEIFIQVAVDAPERILHQAVLGEADDLFYELLIGADVPVEVGQLVFAFFEQDQVFVKQPARLARAERLPEGLLLGLETTGDPVCAERRRKQRALDRR